MGGSLSGSRNSSKTTSSTNSNAYTVETGLSKEQLAILQQRQQQYNATFFPAIQQGLNENTVGTAENKKKVATLMSNNAQQVNAAFDSAMGTTQQSLAQQGVSGTSSGVAAALKAANERARASALANAYNSVQTSTEENKQKYLEMGLSMSPTATTAAPVGQNTVSTSGSKSESTGKSLGGALSAGG